MQVHTERNTRQRMTSATLVQLQQSGTTCLRAYGTREVGKTFLVRVFTACQLFAVELQLRKEEPLQQSLQSTAEHTRTHTYPHKSAQNKLTEEASKKQGSRLALIINTMATHCHDVRVTMNTRQKRKIFNNTHRYTDNTGNYFNKLLMSRANKWPLQ